ncbi:LacI family DNA-binding transcriptional regulator [Bradyrhizobium sp. WD16]|uniref:LacI family DNA-binding transcriptional regulator n=1 Tax=Bradyrhizobium sp. WD16 TaxID=1521768 RepID=UPI0020A25423|nr:LacI family DNA-binding transcriptional regulator [Bradyrhizobium sp. WD16]UTD29644.1 LacI family transcriptional regulator [Bradyrhizobium sp. WD16]
MKRAAAPTLKQIAKAGGVHVSTVSRALDPKKRHLVADGVADRIGEIARRLGYQPNRLAASLRTGRSHLVGVILPDLCNPVFAPILGGITEALAAAGYAPIVADAGNDARRQIAFIDNLINQRVEGLLLATVARRDKIVGHCLDRGVPTVLVNRFEFRDRVSSVVSDDERGMRLAVDHLVDRGHRVIGHLAGPLATSTGKLRRDGFAKAMARHGLSVHAEEAERYTREAGFAPAKALIASATGMTAMVAANDMLALGALDALRELGLRCPENISLVGHNDMPLVDLVSPPLTTVRIEHRAMGRDAATLLLGEIATGAPALRHVILEPELIVRQSTAERHTRLK